MANFSEHITQAKNNLSFLGNVNSSVPGYWDWQVTISFYVAVHLINAHISKSAGMHYRTHEDVKNAINPIHRTAPSQVEEEAYKSYIKLQQLARRARYLCHDSPQNRQNQAYFTYDKHFAKAIKNLDIVISYIQKKHKVKFDTTDINCLDLKGYKSDIFKVVA